MRGRFVEEDEESLGERRGMGGKCGRQNGGVDRVATSCPCSRCLKHPAGIAVPGVNRAAQASATGRQGR